MAGWCRESRNRALAVYALTLLMASMSTKHRYELKKLLMLVPIFRRRYLRNLQFWQTLNHLKKTRLASTQSVCNLQHNYLNRDISVVLFNSFTNYPVSDEHWQMSTRLRPMTHLKTTSEPYRQPQNWPQTWPPLLGKPSKLELDLELKNGKVH